MSSINRGRSMGEFEVAVLTAVFRLKESNSYGIPISAAVERAIGREVSLGAIYTTLDRLERKGFVTSWRGEATPERGGRAKRYFRIEAHGIRALKEFDARIEGIRSIRPAIAEA